MWLTLMIVALIAGIVIRQASQGMFSALITATLTCCCAALSMGTYEWVAVQWLAPLWKPDYALAVAMGAIFGIPLILLRLAFDQVIRRACLLPALVDRIGGAVCALITAMTTVGMLAVCLQMIPFHQGSVLGYKRAPATDSQQASTSEGYGRDNELLFRPDRFAISLASHLCSGVFSAGESRPPYTPDLLQVIAWVGAAPAEVSRFAPPGSIAVLGSKPIATVQKMVIGDSRTDDPPRFESLSPAGGREFRAIRVKLRNTARDKRKSHIFTMRQFRLAGTVQGGTLAQEHPIAIRLEEVGGSTPPYVRNIQTGNLLTSVLNKIYTPAGNKGEVEIVFELPRGFTPTFLEYKREARAVVSFDDPGVFATEVTAAPAGAEQTASTGATRRNRRATAAAPPVATRQPTTRAPDKTADATASATSEKKPRRSGRRRGGRVRAVTAREGGSRFSDEFPMTLTSYQRLKNAEFSHGALVSGHLVGTVADQAGGTDSPISKFEVPDDKRLLQLSSVRLKARSGLGRILSQTVATIQNYFVEDERGRRYKIIGKYAVGDVGGERMVEVQYFSEPIGMMGGLGEFHRIKEKNLKRDDPFVLLFLVDPGSRIKTFSTGGAASRSDDLRDENLVAPD